MKIESVMEIEARIHELKAEIETMRSSMSASRLDGLPRGRATASRVEMLTVKIIDTEKELADLREEYKTTVLNLSRAIDQRVKGRAATVLYFHYVMREPFAEIANLMNLSQSQISRLHRQGRKEFYGQ